MHDETAIESPADSKLKSLFDQLQRRGFTNKLHDQITKVSSNKV